MSICTCLVRTSARDSADVEVLLGVQDVRPSSKDDFASGTAQPFPPFSLKSPHARAIATPLTTGRNDAREPGATSARDAPRKKAFLVDWAAWSTSHSQ